MSAPLVILILSLLLGLQPLTTDLYLPALPALTASFAAQPAQAQTTLTALLLAFGASQLVWGPLSDRIGRRRVLLIGLTGYTLAAIGSALAGSIETLIVWRILQGAAMGAGTVCARSIVRDLYSPVEGARMMSKGLSGLGVAACLGPAIGGLLSQWLGWQSTLIALVLVGALTLGVVWRYFEESLPQPHPDALAPAQLLATARQITGSGRFWAHALLSTCSLAGLYAFLITSSFILLQLHGMAKTSYGVVLLSVSLFYIIGTILCRWLLLHLGLRRTVAVGGAFSLAGGSLLIGLAWSGISSPWALIMPAWVFMLGHGIHQPCGQSGAIAPFPRIAGAASALTGFVMMGVAFLTGQWIGAHMDGSAQPLVIVMGFWSLMTALIAWLFIPRVLPTAAVDP